MKYGWRERISGAVILVALGAIFLPMLFDDPEPRQQEPEPVMVIEQPVGGGEARQRIIESPQPPQSVAESGGNAIPEPDTRDQLSGGRADSFGQGGGGDNASQSTDTGSGGASLPSQSHGSDSDPIAKLAQSDSNRTSTQSQSQTEPSPAQPASAPAEPAPARTPASSDGDWVVQVGSFGQADNATRLTAKLKGQGFAAYSQPRDNNLTTVYVGPFDSSDAGEKARSELKQAANIQGLLIRKPGS